MNCIWSPVRSPEGWPVCQTCRVPYKGPASSPKRNCGAFPRGSGPAASNGPGGHLLRLTRPVKWLSTSCGGSCDKYAAQMDAWGVAGCEERIEEIVTYLVAQANDHVLLAKFFPDQPKELVARRLALQAIELAKESAGAAANGRLEYVSLRRLADDVQQVLAQLPPDVSGIVGVPRSGMIAASQLACLLHLPLYAFHKQAGLIDCGRGHRLKDRSLPGRLAVIDDTICTGHSTREAKRNWAKKGLPSDAMWVGLYVTPGQVGECDIVGRVLPTPHLLEWNMYNSITRRLLGLDMDGVLCRDPPRQHAPRWLTRFGKAPLIATARPESERAQTEAWLEHWGVRYHRLAMWPGPESGRTVNAVAAWKAEEYVKSGAKFFVESEPAIAAAIHAACGKVVICPTNETVYQ